MMALVHPWFAELHIYNSYRPPVPRSVADIPYRTYLGHCDRVSQRLSTLEWPLMIFIGRGDEAATERRLGAISIRSGAVIEVPTRRDDPEPDWPGNAFFDKTVAWSRLAEIVRGLGVSQLWISGELGFVNWNMRTVGCVCETNKMLNQNGIPVKLDRELIFPGIDRCSQE
ncbi:MAG: hypothetical protein PHG97_07700 [Candidatus Margulisbacteria bacterium]|nr:hypothetical protein [Candidatus Margulisiibacteriota bacterium]